MMPTTYYRWQAGRIRMCTTSAESADRAARNGRRVTAVTVGSEQ